MHRIFIFIFLLCSFAGTAQMDASGNPVFNSVQTKEDTLPGFILITNYYHLRNNVDKKTTAVFVSENPSLDEILKAATELPSEYFMVAKNHYIVGTVLINNYPEKYFSVLNLVTHGQERYPGQWTGDISQNRAEELIRRRYDTTAYILDNKLYFDKRTLTITPTAEIEAFVLKLIKEHDIDGPESSGVRFLSRSEIRKIVLRETGAGGKLDYFTSIKGKEFQAVQIKPRVFATVQDVTLYKWGYACFELGVNTEDDALSIFAEHKGRQLNIRETTYIAEGFNREWE